MNDIRQTELDRAYMDGIIDAERYATKAVIDLFKRGAPSLEQIIETICSAIGEAGDDGIGPERWTAVQKEMEAAYIENPDEADE